MERTEFRDDADKDKAVGIEDLSMHQLSRYLIFLYWIEGAPNVIGESNNATQLLQPRANFTSSGILAGKSFLISEDKQGMSWSDKVERKHWSDKKKLARYSLFLPWERPLVQEQHVEVYSP